MGTPQRARDFADIRNHKVQNVPVCQLDRKLSTDVTTAIHHRALRESCSATSGRLVAAGVPEHVGVRLKGQLGLVPPCPLHHASEPGGAEGFTPLRGEHEERLGLLFALKPPQGPQFVPKDRMGALACPA